LALDTAEPRTARAVEARTTTGSGVFCVCAIKGPVETGLVFARQGGGAVVAHHRNFAAGTCPSGSARARRVEVETVVARSSVQARGGVARWKRTLTLDTGPTRSARAVERRATTRRVGDVGAPSGPIETRRLGARETAGAVVARRHGDLAVGTVEPR
jgi:hypothetical protein